MTALADNNVNPVQTLFKSFTQAEDCNFYRTRLQNDSSRLFSEKTNIEVLSREPQDSFKAIQIQSGKLFDELFHSLEADKLRQPIYILRQKDSWARFEINCELFCKLVSYYNLFPQFLNHVHSFGLKVKAQDENYGGYDRKIADDELSYEFCHTIRYPAKHGRKDPKDPWVMRQMAVYQKFDKTSKRSTWVVLQPSKPVYSQIRETLGSPEAELQDNPMLFHVVIMKIAELTWREYTNYIRKEIKDLEDKALLSEVGEGPKQGYSVTFYDIQRLQNIRKRLYSARDIIDSNLETAGGVRSHCIEFFIVFPRQTEAFRSRMTFHRQVIVTMLEYTDDIFNLLSKILDFRNDELKVATNRSIQDNQVSIRELAEISRRDSEIMTKESRSVKILTYIAMLYLPASLVSSVFNSNLIQLAPQGDTSTSTSRFILTPQCWIYPLITLGLMIVTLVGAAVSQRWMQRDRVKSKQSFKSAKARACLDIC